MKEGINASVIIPTRNRPDALKRTLDSYLKQKIAAAEVLIIDASEANSTEKLVRQAPKEYALRYLKAQNVGAATQRNQGIEAATQPFLLFCDDDILFEPECLARLWHAILSDVGLGGVSAFITNQHYAPPRLASRTMFMLMNGGPEKSYAGKIVGPALTLLPEDRDDLPEVVPVDWLYLGCTVYRRNALPDPVFDSHFQGYSYMEDLTLSLRVARRGWKLANVRTARIYHDSQTSEHKRDIAAFAEMDLNNRHYVMTRVLDRDQFADYFRLSLWEVFQLLARLARWRTWNTLPAYVRGRARAVGKIILDL